MTTVPFTFTDDLATQLAAAVSQVPGVDHLDGGRYGETSTYTPKGSLKVSLMMPIPTVSTSLSRYGGLITL